MSRRRGRKLFPRISASPWSAAARLLACVALAVIAQGRTAPHVSAPRPQTIPLNERVLVVYNPTLPESVEVADYYVARRGIPAANKCPISTAETFWIGDWNDFDAGVRNPIKNCLNMVGRDKILYIVFSYLTPYTAGNPGRAVDQQIADIWDEYASGRTAGAAHPYYAPAQSQGNHYQPFVSLADYRRQPSAKRLYSVWRLDAPSAALAKGLVDKAMQAEAEGLSGRGCFDIRGDINQTYDYRYGSGDWDIHRGAELARRAGFEVVEDSNYDEFGTAPAPLRCDGAALYAGWYSYNNYNDAFTWRPGAIGFHTDSASAYNVRGGTNWSANAVIKGITVTSGAVEEPFLEGVAHPDGVFRNLFEGANVGDALLRNTQWLKWMIANIGDPLYRPFPNGLAPFNSPDAAEPSLHLSPIEVGGGGPASATLKLAAPAPAGGVQVTLASSDYSVATPPPSVTVPGGARAAIFSVNTAPVTSELYARITASYPGGSVSGTLTVDVNRAPSASVTAPASGATFGAPASIAVSANASDRDGTVARVDFYAGSNLIGTDSTSPYSVNWANVPEGQYALTAVATDSAGAQTTSNAVNISVTPPATQTPTISINDVAVSEGNTGTTSAAFTVQLSSASSQTVTVKYQTADGAAVASADYNALPPTTLTFAPGQTSLPVAVQVKGDLLDEVNETFGVNLSSPTNATIADGSGTGTITDNDAAPSLRVNRVAVTEVNPGTVNATFAVSLSARSGQTVTVKCQTTNGTAVAPADYTALPLATLTFAPGQTSLPVTVQVKGDLLDEANETFNLVLSAPVNATLAVSRGIGTILDNNPAPTISVNNVTVTEGNSGALNAVFTVRLSAASGRNVSVKHATADGTAAAPADYTARALATLVFYPGQTAKTVAVPVKGDLLDEPNETFQLTLSAPVNATLTAGQGTGTILDNDPAP
ncbi:MAG TPA: TIGR03790 family protein [Pyrinomonadaceae bacterium]|nr:TIGR03790 family protein [Pyrinomonadaceae bacterium]